jgi:hypothetical protein
MIQAAFLMLEIPAYHLPMFVVRLKLELINVREFVMRILHLTAIVLLLYMAVLIQRLIITTRMQTLTRVARMIQDALKLQVTHVYHPQMRAE